MRSVILLFVSCSAIFGQTAEPVAFEVASVKAAGPQVPGQSFQMMRGGPGSSDPGRVTFTGFSMMSLVLRAYDAKPFQVNGPAWLDAEKYDITATISPGATKEQFQLMMRNLLAERFHMALHHETKQTQGYEMAIGKNGSKLKASAEVQQASPSPRQQGPPGMPGPPKVDPRGFPVLDKPGLSMMFRMSDKGPTAHLAARAQPISALIQMLSGQLHCPIVDKTGLTGNYDYQLEYTPDLAAFGPRPAQASAAGQAPLDNLQDAGSDIVSAFQEQLGLKLEKKKVALDMLIIDRVEKVPTEN